MMRIDGERWVWIQARRSVRGYLIVTGGVACHRKFSSLFTIHP